MGVDLTLLPITYESNEILIAEVLFPLDSNSLVGLFTDIPAYPVEKKFISHVASLPEAVHESLQDIAHYHHYFFGVTGETAYGDSLKYIFSGDIQAVLKSLSDEELGSFQYLEKAAIAYLMALNPTHKIVCYWW